MKILGVAITKTFVLGFAWILCHLLGVHPLKTLFLFCGTFILIIAYTHQLVQEARYYGIRGIVPLLMLRKGNIWLGFEGFAVMVLMVFVFVTVESGLTGLLMGFTQNPDRVLSPTESILVRIAVFTVNVGIYAILEWLKNKRLAYRRYKPLR